MVEESVVITLLNRMDRCLDSLVGDGLCQTLLYHEYSLPVVNPWQNAITDETPEVRSA